MDKKKIVICHTDVSTKYGGAEIHVEQLYHQLKTHGYEVNWIKIPYSSRKSNLEDQMNLWREYPCPEDIDLVITTRFPSYGIQHRNKITWLIHQCRAAYELFGTKYSDFKDTASDTKLRSSIKLFDETSLLESKKIFTNSQNTANRLKKFNRIDGEALYHPPKLIGKYYHKEYGKFILSVGRLEKLKRIDLLIEAMKFIPKKVTCIIAGTGSKEKELKKLVKKHNLNDRVKFLGFVDDKTLLKLYASCFAVYYAPYDEDYGYVTLEAFLSKKPVITCTDSGGILEFVRDGENGYIRNPIPLHIGEAITNLYEQRKNLCPLLGTMGYERVSGITWDHVIKKITQTLK
ncbi:MULTISPECIES: glycosyltransferase family 4 protein [unclassified Paenibacillus]|uniref:glycosyltransferase family 4 protein n=1 Tax=unclassified Paenibacillus TaxID=185978 RepID=UPI001AE29E29|nr:MULTISPECIES: glycosyltransferase family 4 protein [unclassified Paenibacillus]MBP1155392.1 glycosyltransferase involved in cell wall biosynthesis [Paenibacillus sp. PvP091]MBP1169223.1 glycosyltransferase involved in cell wall biosynthesis [Paenibacillus sp. PvR098]MBP2440251.1 glycosyltransferase involved in cell wall biosynthesis [Paenibacillus sp. PvP052]